MQIVFYDGPNLPDDIQWSRVTMGQDIDVNLQLLSKGYEIWGILKRNSVSENQTSRIPDDIFNKINLEYADMTDMSSLLRILKISNPDEIYNLAAQSHVRISFEQPIYTTETIAIGTLNLLEAMRIICPNSKFVST